MENIIEELKYLYNKLDNPNSCVPDISLGRLFDMIDQRIKFHNYKKDVIEEFKLIKNKFDIPNCICPDVNISDVFEFLEDRIAFHLGIENIVLEFDKRLLAWIWLKPRSIRSINLYLFWFEEIIDEDVKVYIDLLLEAKLIHFKDDLYYFGSL